MANSVDPDQSAPIGAVSSGSMLYASILNLSVMLGNYLQQTTSADDIFFFFAFFFLALKGLSYMYKLSNLNSRFPIKVYLGQHYCTVQPVISSHSKRRQKLVFKTDYCLIEVKVLQNAPMDEGQKYCRMLQWSILQYF